MPKQKLTDPFIKNLSKPEKRISYQDSLISGLTLRVSPGGTKSFYFRYSFAGEQKRYLIGHYPAIGLADARELTRGYAYKVSTGVDPAAEADQMLKNSQYRVSDLVEFYQSHYLSLKKESTQKSYSSRINKHIKPMLGDIPIKAVSKDHVRKLINKIAFTDGNPKNSNRVRAILSSIMEFALDQGLVDTNPVRDVKKVAPETARDRVYSDSEVKVLWNTFEMLGQPLEGYMKMLLLCLQRKTETRKMQWSHIENGVWTVGSASTKNSLPHTVPLSDLALEVLQELKQYAKKSDFVFKARQKKNSPIPHVSYAMKRVREISGVSDFRFHDMRRTAATNVVRVGYNRTIAGKIMNHKQLAGDNLITAVYTRYEYMEEKREALQAWADHIKNLLDA